MRVHIVGAAGYAAAEIIRLLGGHPHAELATLESKSGAGQRVGRVFPFLPYETRTFDGEGTARARCLPGDIVVLAGHRESAYELAPGFLAQGARVLDLSDAFRAHGNHPRAVYGFPERYRDAISRAELVANPGCYPTATLLALLPMTRFASTIAHVVVDAKSGITGAGRNPSVPTLFAEVDDDVRVYGLEGHRHAPEIGQEIRALGIEAPFIFTPHVVPLSRGMLADVYVLGRTPFAFDAVAAEFERAYASSPFVHVFTDGRVPNLPSLEKTNDAQITVTVRDGIAHLICGIDNLGKGAAANAVQNLNIMNGYPEETGLGARTTVA